MIGSKASDMDKLSCARHAAESRVWCHSAEKALSCAIDLQRKLEKPTAGRGERGECGREKSVACIFE